MGSPSQFDELAAAVFESGCAYLTALLPGHGKSGRDFVRFRYADCETYLQGEIERYSAKYEKIYLVGHSMGCLLSLGASVNADSSVRGLFLIAPALKINYFSPRANLFRIKMSIYPKTNALKSAYINACSVAKLTRRDRLQLARPAIQFLKLEKVIIAKLKDVTVPVFAVFSKHDETVALRSAKTLRRGLVSAPYEQIILTDSNHTFYTEHDRATIRAALLAFIGAH
jgi:carboxylesterase